MVEQRIENVLRERILRWLGRVISIDHSKHSTMGGSLIQERTRSAKDNLERHSQERPVWEEAEAADVDRKQWSPVMHPWM